MIPPVNPSAMFNAGSDAYQNALRRYPRHWVLGGLLVGGSLSLAVFLQTQGIRHIDNRLDLEPPLCKKVHCFVRSGPQAHHKRLPGYYTVGDLQEELTGKPPRADATRSSLVLSDEVLKEFPLDPKVPIHSLCRTSDPKVPNLPCTLHLQLIDELKGI